jgi:hypothetical protein
MIPKGLLVLLAVLALGGAVGVWAGDGSGGETTTTTSSAPSTTITSTSPAGTGAGTASAAGVTVKSAPGAVTTATTPGHPARSSELTLVILLLGVALVFGIAGLSSGRITRLDFPGGGGFTLGTEAQAQVSGHVAQNFTDPASAQRAYELAVALLRERKGEVRVDALPDETVKQVVSEATAAVKAGSPPPQPAKGDDGF